MKKISCLLLFIGLIQFLSGCSQGYRSQSSYTYQAQQQAAKKYHQQQRLAQQRRIQSQKVSPASYKRRPQTSHRLKPATKARYSSQQASSRAVVSHHPARNQMMKVAFSTVGTPYKWGGNNPQQGFDCSGLMKYVYKNATGINIPRTAAQQRDKSRTVDYAQLQPGDMLFFKTGRNSNHVGVYVGNRRFVHAATGSKHVKVASMDSSYWHSRFVKFGTFL